MMRVLIVDDELLMRNLLREWVDGEYTGDTVMTVIQSTLRHGDRYGDMLAAGSIVMGILPYRRPRSI